LPCGYTRASIPDTQGRIIIVNPEE